MKLKEKLSIINGKPSFERSCTYGSGGNWALHVYTRPKSIPREKFDKDCEPKPPKENLGKISIQDMVDRLKIYIGKALGSQEEPSAELAHLLAPDFDDARLLVDDDHAIVITAETGSEYYLFKYTTK
jgi:hypothetical protein